MLIDLVPLDRRGYPRSPVTLSSYRQGVTPGNAGRRFPAETLTVDELERLLAAIGRRGKSGPRNRALIGVMAYAGLRVAEALALLPKDVDLDDGSVRVLHGKGDKARIAGLHPRGVELVEAWMPVRAKLLGPGRTLPLFCVISQGSVGRRMHSAYVREMLRDYAAKAEIDKRVHPHGLRHTHAAHLARQGVPVHIIQRQLGHASLAVTARYVSHLTPHEVVDAVHGVQWGTVSHEPAVPSAPAGTSAGAA